MRHGAHLRRLSLSIEKRTKKPVVLLVAYFHTAIPEFLGIGLVGHIIQHAGNLTIFDFVEYCSTELEVVPLLVYLIRPTASNVNTFFNVLDHLFTRVWILSGSERYIRHTLKLNIIPAL